MHIFRPTEEITIEHTHFFFSLSRASRIRFNENRKGQEVEKYEINDNPLKISRLKSMFSRYYHAVKYLLINNNWVQTNLINFTLPIITLW